MSSEYQRKGRREPGFYALVRVIFETLEDNSRKHYYTVKRTQGGRGQNSIPDHPKGEQTEVLTSRIHHVVQLIGRQKYTRPDAPPKQDGRFWSFLLLVRQPIP
jgi:hypothetical protein